MVLLRERNRRLVGFIEPCLPSPAKAPPSGPDWIHEIKHDGFRIMARRDAAGVRLISRKGNDLTRRFPFIAMAVAALPVPSCLIDGEAVVCDESGLAAPACAPQAAPAASPGHRLGAGRMHKAWRRQGRRGRGYELAKLLRRAHSSLVVNEHFETDGAIVFQEACRLGCEGIVSKRLGSPYRSGRSQHWIKVKNPKSPAVRREAEEEWR